MREMCNEFIVESITVTPGTSTPCVQLKNNCNTTTEQRVSPSQSQNRGTSRNNDSAVMPGTTQSNNYEQSVNTMRNSQCNTWLIDKIGLAQAYVPFQPNADTMEQEQSLVCGTTFADLVQPYVKGSALKRS